MNIDFIKWLVGYADDYMVIEDRIFYEGCYFNGWNDLWERKLHKRNLIQQAIEGVNKTYLWAIEQSKNSITVYHDGHWKMIKRVSEDSYTPDQAKESALEYIYKQEREEP